MNWTQIRDGFGRLLGYATETGAQGITLVTDSKGRTVGYSKAASPGCSMSFTMSFKEGRISQGFHPDLLINRKDTKRW